MTTGYRWHGIPGWNPAAVLIPAEPKSKGGRPATQPCGTNAGYERHKRRHEAACEPCRLARNEKRRKERAAGSAR